VPAPGIAGVSARVELGHPPGPFSVALAPDGRMRQRLTLVAENLPAAASLGEYRTYMAWIATPTMDSIARLGEVRNGSNELGTVELEKFTVLVTAERRPRPSAPDGRVVLRGQSASTRLFPPDFLQFSIGAMG
jgi:hypothetical protein